MENQFVRYFSGLGGEVRSLTSDDVKVQTVLNGFFSIDKNFTVQYCNKVAAEVLGIIPGHVIGKNQKTNFESAVPEEFAESIQRSVINRSRDHYEEYLGNMENLVDVIFYHCDGTLSVSFKRIFHPPEVAGLQQQLMRLNGLYRMVTEITSDCLWEWDLETKEIFWIDGGHKRVFGYEIENALMPQSFWEDRVHADDKERVLDSLRRIESPGHAPIWEQQYRFRKSDGKYAYVKDRGKIVMDNITRGFRMTGTTQDISSMVSLEWQLGAEKLKKKHPISPYGSEAQEKERLEIANHIYNNLSQTLCAARLYIEYSKNDDETRAECLSTSSLYVLNVIDELREIYTKLRLPGMYHGLFDSVRLLINRRNNLHKGVFELNISGMEEDDLGEVLQLDLYRMIEELVDNIVKHARADRAWIDISRYNDSVTLLVTDNGVGCDLLKIAMGRGIIQVTNCANFYAGRMYTRSEPGDGYTFKVVLPLSGRLNTIPQILSDYDDS